MQNTNCSQFSDALPLTSELSVLGNTITVKNYVCSPDGVHYKQKEKTRLQMAILPTSFCPCSCQFCIAEANRRKRNRLDINRLEKVLRRLKEEDVVRGIKITGGEPFKEPQLTAEIIDMIFEIWNDQYLEVSLDTCGYDLNSLFSLKHLMDMDQVHISRHHYDDNVNRSIFGANVPSAAELKEAIQGVRCAEVFVMNCMLMKDYIGNRDEVHKYFDHAIDIGAKKVSFITGNPVNSYIKNQALDYAKVLNECDPSLLFTRGFVDFDICRCRDGVYVSDKGDLIEFYGRCTLSPGISYTRGLVYNADNRLTCNYGGKEIVF